MSTIPGPLAAEIHIHRLTIPHHPTELAHLQQLLSPYELNRASLLKSDRARNRFIAGRGSLRTVLSFYLDNAPEDIQLECGEHGKPFLADNCKNLRFNLAHSGELLLVAVTAGVEVGVDIEKAEAGKPFFDMAKLAFSSQEQKKLLEIHESHLQMDAFYRCWVRKEACMKACGRGFSLPSNSFDVSMLAGEQSQQIVRCNQTGWQVLDVTVPQGYYAALAVESSASSHPYISFINI